MKNLLSIRISSPENLVWEGKGEWVSSINSKGPFDILPMHANFITVVEKHPIKVKGENGKENEYSFDRAVLYTHDNQVSIYVGI